jgi:hypothetical protein
MPLIEIHVLPALAIDRAAAGRRLNASVAAAIPCKVEAVWTVWRTIDGPFVKGDEASSQQTAASFGPIVHVYHHRTPEQVDRAIQAIEGVLAQELGINGGDIFVTSQPVAIELSPA